MNNITFVRNSVFLLPYLLIILTRQYIIFFIVLFSLGNKYKESVFFKILLIFVISMIILRIFRIFTHWATFKYSVGNEALYIKSGLFFKKNTKLPFDKIQNVIEKTPLTFRILRKTSLKIDLGIDRDDGTIELNMIQKSECDSILEKISYFPQKEKSENKEEGNLIYKITNKELLIMSITSLKLIFFIPFLFSIYNHISEYFGTEFLDFYIDKLTDELSLSIWALIIILFLSLIYGYLLTYIKYGKFSVSKDYDDLYIKNGFINLNVRSIPNNKIIALNFTTNILFDLLNYQKVKAITLGERFNVEPNNNVIFPFIKKERTNTLLEKIIPNLLGAIHLKTLSWRSWAITTLFYLPFITIIAIFLSIKNSFEEPYNLFSLILIFTMLYHSFKQSQKKYGVNYNKKIIQIQFGFLIKKTYITSFDNIEQIVIKQSLIQKCFKTCNLLIFIKTNQTKCFKIQNIPHHDCKEIYDLFVNTKA